MKTDDEINEHYKNAAVKPIYKTSDLTDRKQHYAVIAKNDTLPLLLMVHGAPGAWYGYLNLIDDSLLQDRFKIVSVDRLGYGKSGYGKEELSVEMQALAIKKIIDAENHSNKKVYLLGRSYGAPITAWLAIHYPEQFEKLVMVSPVIDPEKEKFYWFSDLGNTALVQWMLPDLLNVATKEKFAHQTEMKKMLPEWQKLCTPTYVLVGEDDSVADTANYSFAKKHITNCTAVFMKLKGTGHRITQEQPELVKELLLQTNSCKDQPYMADNKVQVTTSDLKDATLKN
ncbi:MAG: alpha/beta fold hydrolase [Bacteroidota bacterium]|jgi:pimeloyl-ACP methyl ester carboxylesterase|nr:alpha/beta fold hydrolase [Bacteroidota bacterium]